MKRFKYLFYFLVMILTLSAIGFYYYLTLQSPRLLNDDNLFWYFFVFAPLIIGLLIGAEHLVDEILKKKKGWVFNVPRFLFLGVPSLILSIIFPFCLIFFNLSVTVTISNAIMVTPFASAIFGYILISNFSRKE